MKLTAFVLLFFVMTPMSAEAQIDHPFLFYKMDMRPEPSLKGTRESLVWQNYKLIVLEGLKIIKDDSELEQMITSGQLVEIPTDGCHVVDKRLDKKWHYVLPRVRTLTINLGMDACTLFNHPIKVNSAVRHIHRQIQISGGGNLNAAPTVGERASPHLTGASIDYAVVGVPKPVVQWLKFTLLELERLGLVDVTLEDVAQNVIHATVFEEYPKK